MASPLNEITSWHFRSQIAHHDPSERLEALEALRIRRDPEALIKRSAPLLADQAEEVRLAAAAALISVGGKAVGDLAGAYLEHDDSAARAAAESVLAAIGRTGVGPALQRLEHPSPPVRASALRALRGIGARMTVNDVAVLLGDSDPEVVTEAVRAVSALKGTDFLADLAVVYRRVPEARLAVLEALTVLDAHQSLDLFEAAAMGSDPELRRAALEGLRAAGSPRSERILGALAAAAAGPVSTQHFSSSHLGPI